jgi:hypothetical protein
VVGNAAIERHLAAVVSLACEEDLLLDVAVKGDEEVFGDSLAVGLGELLDEAGLDILDVHRLGEGKQYPTLCRRCQACKKSIVNLKW